MIYQPKRGNPGLQRRFPGVAPIRRSVPAEHYATVNAILDVLFEDEQLESLRAFQAGTLSVTELLAARRKDRLTDEYLLERIRLDRPLRASLRAAIDRLGDSEETRDRYRWSLAKLERLAKLPSGAKVRALARIPWTELRRRWPGRSGKPPCSAADWMRLRQMIGATLTVHLGDVHHPFRRRVMKAIPRLTEKPRVVELTADEFWTLVDALPPQAKPGVVTLAATGFRLGEYLACQRRDLSPGTLAVRNPAGKTGADVVYVAEWLWPWVEAAIPAPIQERWLRIHFRRAATKIEKPELRLHDLRHLFGQLAADEGVEQSKIQAALRHQTASMTARYLTRRAKQDVAEAVGSALKRRRKA